MAPSDRIGTCSPAATFSQFRSGARYTDSQAMELLLLPCFYRMVAGFVNTLGVEREPGVPGWPAELSTGAQ